MSWPPQAVALADEHVALEPLARESAAELAEAARDGALWELWYTTVPAPEAVPAWIETALADQAAGRAVPFQVRAKSSGKLVGSTRYMNIERDRPRLEIGSTWYAARTQRSALNTACKLLLLGHAFDTLGCIAVELRTHWFNFRSREAIARLGAKQDGVLRNHMIVAGVPRDTVVFSIVAAEWPTVRTHLRHRLARLPQVPRH